MKLSYADECAIQDELLEVGGRFDKPKVFIRKLQPPSNAVKLGPTLAATTVVDRDRVVCALAVKAIRTARAVRLLCDHDLPEDAMAMARVLFENAITLAWCYHGPGTVRFDTYCMATAATRTRWIEIFEKYYTVDAATQAKVDASKTSDNAVIANEIFDGLYLTWAIFDNEKGEPAPVKIRTMFEQASAEPSNEASFIYEATYFETSAFIHSHPASLDSIAMELQEHEYFTTKITAASTELRDRAIGIANLGLVMALSVADLYANLGFEAALDAIFAKMKPVKASAEPTDPIRPK